MNIVYGTTVTGDQFSSGRKIEKIGNAENYGLEVFVSRKDEINFYSR